MNWNYSKSAEISLNYNKLKKYIKSIERNGEWDLSVEHLNDLENQIKEKDIEINKYKNFFNLMGYLIKNAS